ncbi:MAG: hypothetical protein H6538_04350 [Bacteroidales bacterium]|nr:hypothetical protein [Bacteroidales bacterium]MCB8999863.1 hypothetical protein [Bacteroidales bacterium]
MRPRKIVVFLLILLFASLLKQSSAQVNGFSDSLGMHQASGVQLHYSLGSSFSYIPKFGSLTGISFSPYISYPLGPKISVQGGFILGRYNSFPKNFGNETLINNSFNAISVYGSARYQLNERLSFYGSGIKQLSGSPVMFNQPLSSFRLGSELNFGNFSLGAEIQMSKWNEFYSPFPFSGEQELFPVNPW